MPITFKSDTECREYIERVKSVARDMPDCAENCIIYDVDWGDIRKNLFDIGFSMIEASMDCDDHASEIMARCRTALSECIMNWHTKKPQKSYGYYCKKKETEENPYADHGV